MLQSVGRANQLVDYQKHREFLFKYKRARHSQSVKFFINHTTTKIPTLFTTMLKTPSKISSQQLATNFLSKTASIAQNKPSPTKAFQPINQSTNQSITTAFLSLSLSPFLYCNELARTVPPSHASTRARAAALDRPRKNFSRLSLSSFPLAQCYSYSLQRRNAAAAAGLRHLARLRPAAHESRRA